METKYLKTWEGKTSGSFLGRDDGYPETKMVIYSSLKDISRDFGTRSCEVHYKLEEMDHEDLEESVEVYLMNQHEIERKAKKVEVEIEIKRLQRELRYLS